MSSENAFNFFIILSQFYCSLYFLSLLQFTFLLHCCLLLLNSHFFPLCLQPTSSYLAQLLFICEIGMEKINKWKMELKYLPDLVENRLASEFQVFFLRFLRMDSWRFSRHSSAFNDASFQLSFSPCFATCKALLQMIQNNLWTSHFSQTAFCDLQRTRQTTKKIPSHQKFSFNKTNCFRNAEILTLLILYDTAKKKRIKMIKTFMNCVTFFVKIVSIGKKILSKSFLWDFIKIQ